VTFPVFSRDSFQKSWPWWSQLGKTFVGKSKDNLDHVTPDLVAADVIRTFGPLALFVDPPCLRPETFDKISFIPDPIPQADGDYKTFEEVYGTTTTKQFRPSLSKRSAKSFSASIQHVRNVDLMVQCEECEMWHLLYSPRKLSPGLRKQLSTFREDYTYTYSATLSDLELPDSLSSVGVHHVECYDPLEKLYFSMKYVWSDLYLLLLWK